MEEQRRPHRRLIVVGASAGGVPALSKLVAGLAPDLGAPVLVVLHLPPHSRSVLPSILERAGHLRAAHPRDEEPIAAGYIYVAPPDRHLLIDDGVVRVVRGPWENGYRPSIDALFRSAAHWHGPGVIGVVLSGALDDGTAGLAAVAEAGGTALVQDPAEAGVPDMPTSALRAVPSAAMLSLDEIAATLNRLASEPVAREPRCPPLDPNTREEPAIQQGLRRAPETVGAEPAGLACPDCAGSLFLYEEEPVLRYRCRVGHGWTADALVDAHARDLEQTLWTAVRILEDDRAVLHRLAARAERHGRHNLARANTGREDQRERLIAMLRAANAGFGAVEPGDAGNEPENT